MYGGGERYRGQIRWRDGRSGWRGGLAVVLLTLLVGCGDDDDEDDPDNTHLASLVLSAGTLEPDFDSDRFEYVAEVANDVTEVTVTAVPENPAATFTVNGAAGQSGTPSAPQDLVVGENTVEVQVTSEDSSRKRTYSVIVTRRPPPSNNAALSSLALTGAPLDQLFQGDVQDYTASMGFLGASTRVVAEPEDPGAALAVGGVSFEAGKPSPYVPLAEGETVLEVAVTAEDGVGERDYAVTVTRAERASLAQRAYLKASNPDSDRFGHALDLSGDILVVGAPQEFSAATGIDGDQDDDSLANAGAVYAFENGAGGWLQTAYLKASNTGREDRFGDAVSLHQDLLVVGAPGENSLATGIDGDEADNSGTEVGAAYLFERDGGAGAWSQAAYLKADNAGSGDGFGFAVAVHGDRVLVGADLEDSDATGLDGDGDNNIRSESGAAYLFERRDGAWEQTLYLKAANAGSGDRFGAAVAIADDLMVVGAPLEMSNGSGVDGPDNDALSAAGAAYVFTVDDAGDWRQAVYLKASNPDPGDRFGTAVAVAGDLVVVGAPGEDGGDGGVGGDQDDNSLDASGAVYVFERDQDGEWSQVAYLKSSAPGSQDEFGAVLALRGNTLAVAAAGENSAAQGLDGDQDDESALNSGAVYVFERGADGAFEQRVYVKASNSGGGDAFGSALALDGDTLAVGAPDEDSAASGIDGDQADNSLNSAGAVYLLR